MLRNYILTIVFYSLCNTSIQIIAAIVTIDCLEMIYYHRKLLGDRLMNHNFRDDSYTDGKIMNESHSIEHYMSFYMV